MSEYHDYVLTIEEKNSAPMSDLEFEAVMAVLRIQLEGVGFKLESYGPVSSAIIFYGKIYLERLKDAIEDKLKEEDNHARR